MSKSIQVTVTTFPHTTRKSRFHQSSPTRRYPGRIKYQQIKYRINTTNESVDTEDNKHRGVRACVRAAEKKALPKKFMRSDKSSQMRVFYVGLIVEGVNEDITPGQELEKEIRQQRREGER